MNFQWGLGNLSLVFFLITLSPVQAELVTEPQLPANMDFIWMENPVGFQELFVNAVVQLPPEPRRTSVQVTEGSKIATFIDNKVQFLMSGTHETISDEQNQVLATAKLQNLPSTLISKDCEGLDMELVQEEAIPNGTYIGIFCNRSEDKTLRVWISAPSDIRWGETSIFEQSGKGERWRGYEIRNFAPIENELLHATFRFYTTDSSFGLKLVQKPNAELLAKAQMSQLKLTELELQKKELEDKQFELEQKKLNLQIENKVLKEKAEGAEKRERLVHVFGSLGGGMISVKTSTAKKTTYQGALFLESATKPLWYTLGAGGQVKYVPPVGKIALWDIAVGAQSTWTFNRFMLRPGIGFHNFGLDLSEKRLAFRHSSIGLDLYFQYGSEQYFWLLASTSGLVPSGKSKYYSASMGYRFPISHYLHWGPRLVYQYVTYPDAKGKFSQIFASMDVGF